MNASTPGATSRAFRLRWWVLATIGVAQLMVILDTSIVNIALPSAQDDLGFSDGNRQWVLTAYALAFGSLLLIGGRLADLFGERRAFLTGLAGFACASALGGAAPSFDLLVIARALQGLFAALLAPAALSLVSATFADPRERGQAFGIFGAIAGAGGAIGLLAGGVMTEYLDWRWCMYVNVPIAVVALVGGSIVLQRPSHGQRPRLDGLGTVLVCLALFCLVYALSGAESSGWASITTLSSFALGVALLVAFVLWQSRTRHPLLPLRILLDRTRGASFVCMFIAGVGQFGSSLFLTYYLQDTLGYSPVQTGLAFLPIVVTMVAGSIVSAGHLVPRYGPKIVMPIGMALTAISLAWLTTTGVHSSYVHLDGALALMGLGLGIVSAPAISLATQGVDADDTGVASATVNTVQQVGGALGIALLNTLAAGVAAAYLASHPHSHDGLIQAAVHSYHAAYWAAAALFAVGVLLSASLYRRQPRR